MSITVILLLMWVVARLFVAGYVIFPNWRGTRALGGVTPFAYRVTRARYGAVQSVALAVAATPEMRFVMRRENWGDRLAKTIGLAHPMPTHDAEFDHDVYVIADDAVLGRGLATDALLRQGVLQLFADPTLVRISCRNGWLWGIWRPKGVPRTDGNAEIGDTMAGLYLDGLNAIASELARLHAGPWTAARDPSERLTRLFYAGTAVMAAVTALMVLWSLTLSMPRALLYDHAGRDAGLVALIAAVAVLGWAYARLGASSRLHLVLLETLVTLTPCAWLLGRAIFAELNMHADPATPSTVVLNIQGRTMRSGKHTSYFLFLGGWPDSRIAPKFEVTAAEFSAATEGRCVAVAYHGGLLGDPWISRFDVGGPCDE